MRSSSRARSPTPTAAAAGSIRHGDHVPDDGIKELRAKISIRGRGGPAAPGRGRRRAVRDHAGDLPGRAPADPVEAVSRLGRDRRRIVSASDASRRRGGGAQGFDALVVAPSPDLAYLSGYDPMPLERPRCSCSDRTGPRRCSCPSSNARSPRRRRRGRPRAGRLGRRRRPLRRGRELLPHEAPGGGRRSDCGRRHLLGLQRGVPDVAFGSASPVIGRLRAVKDDDELAALRRAGRGADESFRQICTTPFAGRREEDIAADLAELLGRATATTAAEFTIVASGPNAASPHHEPGGADDPPQRRRRDGLRWRARRLLQRHDADGRRGRAAAGLRARLRRRPTRRRRAACEAVRPGRRGSASVDRAAAAIIDEAGFGERFIHRTGHGIGLEVHEPPYVVEGNDWTLEPGMTFCVEPGVYLDGRVRRADRGHRRGHRRRCGAAQPLDPRAPGGRVSRVEDLSSGAEPSCPPACP